MKIRTLIASATTAALLATGGVAIAGAATGSGGETGSNGSDAPTERPAHPGFGRGGRMAMGRGMLKIAADTIGVEPKDLLAAVQDGKTVAAVAEEHDVTAQAVIDAIVTDANKRIDALAEKHDIAADRVTKMKERAADAAERFVNETGALAKERRGGEGGRFGGKGFGHRLGGGLLDTAATAIGIESDELLTELKAGKTVAEVAQAHDVDPQTVIDAIVAAGQERLEKMADKFVNGTLPQGPGHGGGPDAPDAPAPDAEGSVFSS